MGFNKVSSDNLTIVSSNSNFNYDENFDEVVKTKSHDEISRDIESKPLGEVWRSKNNKKKRTRLHTIMTCAINGGDIISKHLDTCVTTTAQNPNDPDYAFALDMRPFNSPEDDSQADIVKDILDLLENEKTKNAMLHPVIVTFLETKWNVVRIPLFLNVIIFFIFAISYNIYLVNVFFTPREAREALRNLSIKTLETSKDPLLGNERLCLAHSKSPIFCWTLEIILYIFLILLAFIEILKVIALGPRRWICELATIVQLLILISATLTVIGYVDIKTVKYISAFGITLAWIQLLFMQGRYPFYGHENISTMFYVLISYFLNHILIGFITIVFGFASGFYILTYDKTASGTGFDTYFQGMVRTFTMILGELEFKDMFDAHDTDNWSRATILVLMSILALSGTLILINLAVALIVADLDTLKLRSYYQALQNMAQHTIFIDSVVTRICGWGFQSFRKKITVPEIVNICGHRICNCQGQRINQRTVDQLGQIVKERRIAHELEDFMSRENPDMGMTLKNLREMDFFNKDLTKTKRRISRPQ